MDPPGAPEIVPFDSSVYDWHTAGMDTSAPPAGIAPQDWAATPVVVQQFLTSTPLTPSQHFSRGLGCHTVAHPAVPTLDPCTPAASDPPSAPPRSDRVPRGRKPGAQAGHPRHERPDPAPDQITSTSHHYPSACPTCGDNLTAHGHDVCAIQTQYVWDVPPIVPLIEAHHYHTVCCPTCHALVTGQRPADVPAGAFGPRTAALVGLLHGRYRISDRELLDLFADLFQLPLCPEPRNVGQWIC